MEQYRRGGGQSVSAGKLPGILKSLLFAYILTGGLLLLLAFLLYRFQLSEGLVSAMIVGIYAVSAFFAGFMAGKCLENRKFMWGILEGLLYFVILLFVSLLINHTIVDVVSGMTTALAVCGISGMLGGMLS